MIGHLSIYRVLKFALLLGRGKIFGVVLFSFQLPLGASICQTKYTAEPALNKPWKQSPWMLFFCSLQLKLQKWMQWSLGIYLTRISRHKTTTCGF